MKPISFLYAFDLGNRNVNNPSQNIVSVTSTLPGDFDISNITSDSIRQSWRSASVLSKQEIVIKADRISNINCFAILGHNFTDIASIQVQANYSNNFLAPPVTKNVVWDRGNLIIPTEFGGNYEYYKISILDPTNPCGYLEIGRVVGGRVLTLVNNENITDSYQIGNKDMSETLRTQGYSRASSENITVRTLSVNFSKLHTEVGNDINFKNLRSMFRTVKTIHPFLVILDMDDPYFFNIWCQIPDVPDESFTVNNFVSFPFKAEEVF